MDWNEFLHEAMAENDLDLAKSAEASLIYEGDG